MFTHAMITELVLTNFKCFKEETHIPLSKLNIFTGTNGSGKSSAIQALLLIAQKEEGTYLPLNGIYVSLGDIKEIKHKKNIETEPIIIGFRVRSEQDEIQVYTSIQFVVGELNDLLKVQSLDVYMPEVVETQFAGMGVLPFNRIHYSLEDNGNGVKVGIAKFYIDETPIKSAQLHPFSTDTNLDGLNKLHFNYDKNKGGGYSTYSIGQQLRYLYYIPANRIGPQSYYFKHPFNLKRYSDIGQQTEKLLSQITLRFNNGIDNAALLPSNTRNTLKNVLEYWLSYIFGNDIKLDIKADRDTIYLNIDDINPTMTGFGYSYILPILYAGVMSMKGIFTIIVDNPELHLTPKSQSRLMEFLCKVANSGVQVFVETHSDHIINGARVMLREQFNQKAKEDGDSTKGISPDDISILWFENDKESSNTKVTQVEVKENGKYGHVPKGFFDQMDNDLNKILGFTV